MLLWLICDTMNKYLQKENEEKRISFEYYHEHMPAALEH